MKITQFIEYYLLLCACFFNLKVAAQQEIYVEAQAFKDAIGLTFFPVHPTTWAAHIQGAYQIERWQLADGQPLENTRILLAQNIKAQSQEWFENHKNEAAGLMQAVGALLYDTSFQFQDKSLIDNELMQWSYIMQEAKNRPAIAAAIGALFIDSTAVLNQQYRYTIRSITNADLRVNIDMDYQLGAQLKINEGLLNFQFPENRSLSDMLPQTEKPVFPQVFALAKAFGDSIMIRWAPNTPDLWKNALTTGYVLTRKELNSNSNAYPKIDSLGIFKPWSKTAVIEWTKTGLIDSMALLAGSILYNENEYEKGPITEQAQVFESKYGFALFAAESSPLAAQILGLGYVDKNVARGKTYSYQITALEAPENLSKANLTIKNEIKPLPQPMHFAAESGDQRIKLYWEIIDNVKYFSAYELARSDNEGKSWQALHDQPLTFISTEAAPLSNYSFQDSVEFNYKNYQYRLRGMDSFGAWSPWTSINAQAVDLTPPPMANLLHSHYNDTTNTAHFQWEVAPLPTDFEAFYLLIGASANGAFDTLAQLKKELRSYIWQPDTLLDGNRSYFFRVLTKDIHGNFQRSLERYMTVPDLIPPLPPALVAGNIAEDGTVSIVWEHSTASDLTGYWVYAANSLEQEFPILNKEMLTDNSYSWKIATRNLNETLYVLVSAEDRHHNRGEVSEVLILKRPDKVPPRPPILESVKQKAELVQINWKASPSEDCEKYHLLRREIGENSSPWQLIDTLGIENLLYEDASCQPNMAYKYALLAEDDAQNLSDTSNALSFKMSMPSDWLTIADFKIVQQNPQNLAIDLTWEYESIGNDYEILLYRSSSNQNVHYLSSLPAHQNSYTDVDIKSGVIYNYALQVRLLPTGNKGKLSQVLSILTQGKNPIKASTNPPLDKPKKAEEIAIRGQGFSIGTAQKIASTSNGTDFGSIGTGTILEHTFTIQNKDNQRLTNPIHQIKIESNQAAAWSVSQPIVKTKGYGGIEAFTVTFQPSTAGTFHAKVLISGKSKWEFTVKGIGIAQQKLAVLGNGIAIQNGDNTPSKEQHTDFGGLRTGKKEERVFLIKNIGAKPLIFEDFPKLDGDSAFTISPITFPKSLRLAANEQATLRIRYSPSETGIHRSTLSIKSNDETDGLFKFDLTGFGTGPEINIENKNKQNIADDTFSPTLRNGTDFGQIAVHQTTQQEFIIKNTGDLALEINGTPRIVISGENAAYFSVEKVPDAIIKPGGGESNFVLKYAPKQAGQHEATIIIFNSDADEKVYNFMIRGRAL
jgi:fibronectin type 3 domain-containing protein